jgi:predicted signal transduction protein with EAL and GGDEF domain
VAAQRVAESLRPSATAARLGSDEFAVLLDDIGDETAAMSIATRLADALRAPMDLVDVPTTVGARIGIALSGHDGETADDLMRRKPRVGRACERGCRARRPFRTSVRFGSRVVSRWVF